MCDDNLLDILKSGGDLNNVNQTTTDNLSPTNENANLATYYVNNGTRHQNDKNNKED